MERWSPRGALGLVNREPEDRKQVTANGKVLTKEEATVQVRELGLFETVMFLEDTPAVLSLGKLCQDHRNNYHWTSCQKSHHQKRQEDCKTANNVLVVVPWSYRQALQAHLHLLVQHLHRRKP